ncbi:MAG: hypothetical protein R3B09_16000 [Nannocystaceae bacterium]
MTPSEALRALVPKWRESLPSGIAPADVDDFVARHRRELESILGQLLAVRRLRRGGLPRTAAEFTAMRLLAERARPRHAETDRDLVKILKTWAQKRTRRAADAEAREALERRVGDYITLRAEALLLGQMGWDAVPLLLCRPVLAVYSAGAVVLVHRHGEDPEAVFPGFAEESLRDLRRDVEVAHEAADAIVDEIGDRGPEAIWARARGRAGQLLRDRARVVCRHCGVRLKKPERHYAIGTHECPAGAEQCISIEEDEAETRRRQEASRRLRAEHPVPVFVPPDTRADKERRRAERERRRKEREREKEEAARRREEKAAARAREGAVRAKARAQESGDCEEAQRFEAGEVPRTADEFAVYRRFAARHYDQLREMLAAGGEGDDDALLAWVLRRQAAQLGRRHDIDIEERVIGAGLDYALLRAESILLRALGHDPIPLLVERAALLVELGDRAILHRHFPPELALLQDGEVTIYHDYADAPSSVEVLGPLREVHAQIERLRRELLAMDLATLAPPLWQAAREIAATVKTSEPDGQERETLGVLLAPEPVDRFGQRVHETRWASRAAAIRQLEGAGFRFIKTRGSSAPGWAEGFWARFPRIAVIKGATVQVMAARGGESER